MTANHLSAASLRLLLLVATALAPTARATVTNMAWFRLGEVDAGAVSGGAVNSTSQDIAGTNQLTRFGSPYYTNRTSALASSHVSSSFGIHFNGSQYLSNGVVSSAINNFGMEMWVKPDTTAAGNRFIVCNGDTLADGWAIFQKGGGSYSATFGGVTSFGSATAVAGGWTHLALVRDNGTATFYVDGVAGTTSVSNPIAPVTGFTVGTRPNATTGQSFIGSIDEVRVFTFAPGQFSTNDFTLNLQRITTLPATALGATNATLNASANPLGFPSSAWFQWGTGTNYGYNSAAQPVSTGINATNFSQQLTNLVAHAYHYRGVGSNILGVTFGNDLTFALTNGPMVPSGPAGAGQPIALGQPVLELNYIICTNGNYATVDDSAQPPFYGEVRLFAGNFAPLGWAFCHGQLLTRTNNLALFSIIGTAFGGDGTNTFALPDARSRGVASIGQGPGLSPISLAERSGLTQTTLLPFAMPIHTHPLPTFYGIDSGPAGSNGPRNNRQPYLGLSTVFYLQGNNPLAAQTAYEPFVGEMTMFASGHGFPNAVQAQGQVFGISANSFLYSIIRTNFGGDGATTFWLPDLRGRFPLSIGRGTGQTAHTLGEKFGTESVTMTTAQMPSHRHTLPSVPPIALTTDTAGSNQPQSLLQPSLAVRFLISTNGQVPSSSVQATNKMLGQIQPYAGTNVPVGWTLCDGQILNVAAFLQLFGVISNYFGGDGVMTFALPNLAGRIPVGSPNGQPGATYGTEQFILTESQLPAHTHNVPGLNYQTWADLVGLTGDAALFEADADGDRAKNGLEWATGTELTNAASPAALTIAPVSTQVQIGFTRNTNATDITVRLQRTPQVGNSAGWSGLATNTGGLWSLPGMVNETGTTSVHSVQVFDSRTNNPSANYRLEITRP
jgi:microcystin-dependent protein